MKITIEGEPISKKRHRCKCVRGHGQAYDVQRDEFSIVNSIIRHQALKMAYCFAPNSFLIVNFRFYLPISDRETNSKRMAKLWGFEKPNKKPDFDNLIKFYCDCANGVLWEDDMEIIKGSYEKLYSDEPRTEMEITMMPQLSHSVQDILAAFTPKSFAEFVKLAQQIGELNVDKIETNPESFPFSKAALLLSDLARNFSKSIRTVERIVGGKHDNKKDGNQSSPNSVREP